MQKRTVQTAMSDGEACGHESLETACLYHGIVPDHLKKMARQLREKGVDIGFSEIEIEVDDDEETESE